LDFAKSYPHRNYLFNGKATGALPLPRLRYLPRLPNRFNSEVSLPPLAVRFLYLSPQYYHNMGFVTFRNFLVRLVTTFLKELISALFAILPLGVPLFF
jgi:hypothetical protein